MKIFRHLALPCALVTIAWAGAPISSVHVTLHGRKYDVLDVVTVQDLQDKVKEASGIDAKQQGRVLFSGKRLTPSDVLSDVGVTDGAQLNMVPSKTKTKSSSASSSSAGVAETKATTTTTTSGNDGGAGGMANLEEMMKNSGLDTSKLDEMMKGMGGGKDGEMPNMEESMEMMQNMMNSPLLQEYMSDPERLEQSRQMILQNPMLKSMMAGMPGMEGILNDPVAWREAMQAAANLYKNMDTNDLMKSMMGGMGGAGGGLFDGTMDSSATTAALDELSEGE